MTSLKDEYQNISNRLLEVENRLLELQSVRKEIAQLDAEAYKLRFLKKTIELGNLMPKLLL